MHGCFHTSNFVLWRRNRSHNDAIFTSRDEGRQKDKMSTPGKDSLGNEGNGVGEGDPVSSALVHSILTNPGPNRMQEPFKAWGCVSGLGPEQLGEWAQTHHWHLSLMFQVPAEEFQEHLVSNSFLLCLTSSHSPVPGGPCKSMVQKLGSCGSVFLSNTATWKRNENLSTSM
jgi:hypothetical protein